MHRMLPLLSLSPSFLEFRSIPLHLCSYFYGYAFSNWYDFVLVVNFFVFIL